MDGDIFETQNLTLRSRILKVPGLKLIEKIGDGGMSTVWKAWDISRQQIVAVKILNKECSGGEDVRAFREEERIMEEIEHPGIVRAFDFDCGNGNWYLIMEYVDGYNFGDLLKRKQHVIEYDCLLICQSVAAALDYAWNDHGIIHCDIKPENIMVNSDGVVKLTDLGISRKFQFLEHPESVVSDHVTGTPAYISPEQVFGDVELDCRTDIYSLGAALYHLATGRLLFPGADNDAILREHVDAASQAPDPRMFAPDLPDGFARMLEKMTVKDRELRYQDWEAVLEDSRLVQSGGVPPPPPPGAVSSVHLGA